MAEIHLGKSSVPKPEKPSATEKKRKKESGPQVVPRKVPKPSPPGPEEKLTADKKKKSGPQPTPPKGSRTADPERARADRPEAPHAEPSVPAQRLFRFRAVKVTGTVRNEVGGTMLGENQRDVIRKLEQSGHVEISVREKSTLEFASRALAARRPKIRSTRVGLNELVISTQQLATMVDAGNPLLASLEALRQQSPSRMMRDALGAIVKDIREGGEFHEALAKHPKIFEELYVNLVKAGEESGRLALNLRDLAENLEEMAAMRSEIISAMTYPVISLFVVVGVSLGILIGVIPKFQEIFVGMGLELPWLTKTVLALSLFLKSNFIPFGGVLLVGLIGLYLYRTTDAGKYRMDWLKLRLPVFGPLFEKVCTARVCNTFALMLRSGVSTLIALDLSGGTTGNRVYTKEMVRIRDRVREGTSLSLAFAEGGVFSFMVGQMLSVGEESGNVDVLLEKLSDFFRAQVRATIKRLTSAIEPILIVTMGILVGTMVLSIFMPIMDLQKTLGGGAG